jgi:flagellar basal body-associated protein FliL
MKKSDIALLVLIVSLTLVISFLVVKTLFGEATNEATKVEKAESISANITEPSPTIFNRDAINPTVVIQIGNSGNQQPFTGQ